MGLIVGGLVVVFGKATLLVAAILAALSVGFLRQRRTTQRLEESTKMLTGIALTAEAVLREAAEADKVAAAAEEGFRWAAQRRVREAEHIAEHGRLDTVITGTSSLTFESVATRNLEGWDNRFNELKTKLEALGFRVVVPAAPRNKIEGEPTAAAIKLVCQREALDVAADALRQSVSSASNASAAPQSTTAAQKS